MLCRNAMHSCMYGVWCMVHIASCTVGADSVLLVTECSRSRVSLLPAPHPRVLMGTHRVIRGTLSVLNGLTLRNDRNTVGPIA